MRLRYNEKLNQEATLRHAVIAPQPALRKSTNPSLPP